MNIDRELDLARTYMGRPLPKDVRARLQAVVDNPNDETWTNAYAIVLFAGTLRKGTLWQNVCAVDRTFPTASWHTQTGAWDRIPDQATLIEALRAATH